MKESIPQWFLTMVTIGITLQIACMGVLINLQIKQSDRLNEHVANHPNHELALGLALLKKDLDAHLSSFKNSRSHIP